MGVVAWGGAVTVVTAAPGAMRARAKAKAKAKAMAMAMAMAKAMAKAMASGRRLVWERADAVSRGRRLTARSDLRVRLWRWARYGHGGLGEPAGA